MDVINFLKRELNENEQNLINNTIQKDRNHPVKTIISNFDRNSILSRNTNNSVCSVLQHDKKWFDKNRHRLTETDDYSTPSSS